MWALLLCLSLRGAAGLTLRLNPVSRVAQLLEGLRDKVERDGEAEQGLYDQYKCWCTKTLNAKSTSMEANRVRIAELSAYIDDLENGRVELTGERGTLEAEVKELEKAIEDAETMRDQEHKEFLAAEDEMTKGVTALDSALKTLQEATKDAKDGVLTSVATQLARAVDLGRGFMKEAQVKRALRTLDVPSVDNEMLNKDTTFNKKYKERSGEIQDVLEDMLASFQTNLADTQSTETTAKSNFDSLMTAKQDQLSTAKAALGDKATETGARNTALQDSQSEKSELETQNSNDDTFFKDTKSECETKAGEWADRKKLRADELASISEAVATLTSDDARDQFQKSYSSLLQVTRPRVGVHRARALQEIRKAQRRSGDLRLAALATKLVMTKDVPTSNPFADVIGEVAQMVSDLEAELAEDETNKQTCENDQLSHTQDAKSLSKSMDSNTEEIDRLNAAIAAAKASVGNMDSQVAMLDSALEQATITRNKENAQYKQSKLDDEGAVDLIETATGVLEDFYTRNNLNLAQGAARSKQEPFVAAGEAPPDAPMTWDGGDGTAAHGGYGGASGETHGIIGILGMLKSDIESDIQQADSDEQAAAAAHSQLETDIDQTITELGQAKGTLDGQIAADEQSVVNEESMRDGSSGDLASTKELLKDIQPGCDFIRTHFAARKASRGAEIIGLEAAKKALEDANFE
jgi:hypothetical protein